MKQMTIGTLKALIQNVPDNMVVFLGDDEELNGIHQAFFAQKCSKEEIKEFSQDQFEGTTGFLIS